MTELAIFGICAAIALGLFTAIGVFFPPLLLLILLFPILASETITGERGSFSPNGSGKKSPLFNGLTVLFAGIQVLLVASLFYGLYRVFAGAAPAETAIPAAEAATSRTNLLSLEISRLLLINTLLWILSGFFLLMLVFNFFRFGKHVKQMPKSVIFFGYGMPLLFYPLLCVFLVASRNYLTQYPAGDQYLGWGAKAAGISYSIFLLSSFFREIRQYVTILSKQAIPLKFEYWFFSAMSWGYKLLFLYFLVSVFRSL